MSDEKSKTAKKREAEELQAMGVALIDFSEERLARIPLSTVLKDVIMEAKTMRSFGAKRRQAQRIGKLMRGADSEAIRAACDAMLAEDKAKTAQFHEIEQWRARLINEGNEALTTFIATYKPDDVQHLRQLIKKAVIAHQKGQSTNAGKALFRYIRACLS